MDTARPYADVIPGPRGRLLANLAQLEGPVTVRALARFADISPQSALGYVNALDDAGIVFVERAGQALMVSLNREHLGAESIMTLATIRERLVDRLRAELNDWYGLAGAWLFGSTARGDGGTDSDVDLLLVADLATEDPGWVKATTRLRERARLWTGNEIQLVEHTRASFTELVESANPLVAAIRTEGISLTQGSRVLLRSPA